MVQHTWKPSECGSRMRTVLLTIAAGILISTGSVSAIDVSERQYVIPRGGRDYPKNGGELFSLLPLLPEYGDYITFTSFVDYQTHRDDDYSVSIQLKRDGVPIDYFVSRGRELELSWARGRGSASVLVHGIALPRGVRRFDAIELESRFLRKSDLPWLKEWEMNGRDRCVVIVQLRRTWGSDDDASYRLRTNNTSGGRKTCTLHADFGHGKRDFRFAVMVLAWSPDETDFDVTVNRISTSRAKYIPFTTLSDLPESDVRISNPVVDWGSDDDVSFKLTPSSERTSTTLMRWYGFREIEFELIGLSSSP